MRRWSIGCFLAACGIFLAAACGLWQERPAREVVVALDISGSVSGVEARAAAEPYARALSAVRTVYLPFAATAGVDASPDSTDIAAALTTAADLPPVTAGSFQRQILLFTDGRDNRGGAELAAAGVSGAFSGKHQSRLTVVPLSWSPVPDAQVRALEVPAFIAPRQPFTATAWVTAHPAGRVRVRLEDAAGRIWAEKETFVASTPVAVVLPVAGVTSGMKRWVARALFPDDRVPENNIARAAQLCRPAGEILWWGAPPPAGYSSLKIIYDSSSDVRKLADCRLLVLNDIAADELAPSTVAAVTAYVKGGGKLFVIGAENFSRGSWDASPLSELLPVAAVPAETLAVSFALDVSGSMGETVAGERKISLALSALRSTLRGMAESDRAGVVAFSRAVHPHGVVPLLPVRETARRAAALDISPTGGTSVFVGVAAALQQLREASARRKLLILLTDGQTAEPPETLHEKIRVLREKLSAGGISLLAVAVGDSVAEDFLQQLTAGVGRVTRLKDGWVALPKVLSAEIRNARAEQRMLYNGTIIARRADPLTAELAAGMVTNFPATGEVRPAVAGELWLTTPAGEALLATSKPGFGDCVWIAGRPWQDWNFPAGRTQGGKFFCGWVSRLQNQHAGNLRVAAVKGQILIRGDAAVAELTPLSAAGENTPLAEFSVPTPESAISAGRKKTMTLTLQPRYPQIWEGTFPSPAAGFYRLDCGGETLPLWIAADEEYRDFGADGAALQRLAAAGGGAVITNPRELPAWDTVPVNGIAGSVLPLPAFGAAMILFAAGLVFLARGDN